ncbi:MAG TPA: nucleotidyltransferase family protein [Saprospiraceae bacterium]|nr:nucleotidyltransferase family protein [Saprospiraceae bacterium]
MSNAITKCAVLILAAGKSSRLGSPKQLLNFEGSALISRVAKTAIDAAIGEVFVVVGANAEEIVMELNMPDLYVVKNEEWEEGMASSIRNGLDQVQKSDPMVDGIMILVCDQPYLNADTLREILHQQRASGHAMAASVYHDQVGTPAVFHRSIFPALMELRGDTGARKIVSAYGEQVALVPFEKGIIDIDTREDYEKLIHNQ